MSLPIPEIIESLKRIAKLDPKTLIALENDLEAKEAEAKNEKDSSGPKAKNAFVVVALDLEGHIKGDLTVFVTQIPEADDAGTVLDRLHGCSYHEFRRHWSGQEKAHQECGGDVEDERAGSRARFDKAAYEFNSSPKRRGPIPTA